MHSLKKCKYFTNKSTIFNKNALKYNKKNKKIFFNVYFQIFLCSK